MVRTIPSISNDTTLTTERTVRLGNSGLKVSRIILGTLQYGSKQWADWVLDEEAAMEQIKYAYATPSRPCVPRLTSAQIRRRHTDV